MHDTPIADQIHAWADSHFPTAVEDLSFNVAKARAIDLATEGKISGADFMRRVDAACEAGVENPSDLAKVAEAIISQPHGSVARALDENRDVADELARLDVWLSPGIEP